jgi:hypothetical protein
LRSVQRSASLGTARELYDELMRLAVAAWVEAWGLSVIITLGRTYIPNVTNTDSGA